MQLTANGAAWASAYRLKSVPRKWRNGELGTAVILLRDSLQDWKEMTGHHMVVGGLLGTRYRALSSKGPSPDAGEGANG